MIKTCWVVVEDGLTGTENQCVGVAEALDAPFEIKRIRLSPPWSRLSPYLGFEQSWSFIPALRPPWPDLVIAAGRKSIAAARYIKKQNYRGTFTVQIQNPRVNPAQFDLVAAPYHDDLRGPNVIVTDAAPNRVTPEKLAQAKTAFAPLFEPLPSPRVAVLIGGTSKAHRMDADITRKLAFRLASLEAGLMVTASRRTGAENTAILKTALHGDTACFWDGKGDNPYFGMLAWADFILVTSDSTSMISDAGTTGKPVYLIDLAGGSKRFDRLYAHLKDKGVVRTFTGTLEPWTYSPLDDAQMIANAIKKRIK